MASEFRLSCGEELKPGTQPLFFFRQEVKSFPMLSNTATPKYYGRFRDAVIRGEIPVCNEISMEMNRVDALIANPNYYYDDQAVDGFIKYCLSLWQGSGALCASPWPHDGKEHWRVARFSK